MDAIVLMMMMGKGMDPRTLHEMIKRQTERRVENFKKLAELLFSAFMFFFGDLAITIDGKAFDPNDASLTADQKLNAILASQKSTNKSTLFRELFRPLLIDAAEFIARMMQPDEMTLGMLGGAGVPGSFQLPGWPAGTLPAGYPATTYPAAAGPSVAPPIDVTQLPGSPSNPIRVQAKPGGSY